MKLATAVAKANNPSSFAPKNRATKAKKTTPRVLASISIPTNRRLLRTNLGVFIS